MVGRKLLSVVVSSFINELKFVPKKRFLFNCLTKGSQSKQEVSHYCVQIECKSPLHITIHPYDVVSCLSNI